MTTLQLSARILSASIIFVSAFAVRDAIKRTFELLPIPDTNIWWTWIIAIIYVLFSVIAVRFLHYFNVIDNPVISNVASA
jgi:hypothetical protein